MLVQHTEKTEKTDQVQKKLFLQSGAALAVSLVMLAMLTIIGVAAISAGLVNFKLSGNLQVRNEVEKALEKAMETAFSTLDPTSTAGTCDPPETTEMVNGLVVSIDLEEPVCLSSVPADFYLKDPQYVNTRVDRGGGGLPGMKFNIWEVRGTAWTDLSGTRVAVRWGTVVPSSSVCSTTTTNSPCSE